MGTTPKSKLDTQLPDKATTNKSNAVAGSEPEGSYGEDGDINQQSGTAPSALPSKDSARPQRVQR